MSDLVEFLKDRLAETEAIARRAGGTWRQVGGTGVIIASDSQVSEECGAGYWGGIAEHMVHNDPARVLQEVEAKRRILQEVWTGMEDFAVNIEESRDGDDCGAREYRDQLLGILALAYTDHPDYQEKWRP